MRPSFSSTLVNDPFGDPGLYVQLRFARRALLFDLGEHESLGPTELLRADTVFISHTHMDHFIGFDSLLRIILGRDTTLRLYGPPGLIENVTGKLQGYTWNLLDGYPLAIEVQEFGVDLIRSARFPASTAFARENLPSHAPAYKPGTGLWAVHAEPMFSVHAIPLNHRVVSMAYALEEPYHINILKEELRAAGLPVGSWLKEVKEHIWRRQPDDFRFRATLYFEHRREEREFELGDIRSRFVRLTRGQKVAYVVDARYDEENETRIVELARAADVFFCEAPYLRRDADKAFERYHLTARQAGIMARKAGVRSLTVFHFSPRYTGQADAIRREAQEAFEGNCA